jgi:hypothetical protein
MRIRVPGLALAAGLVLSASARADYSCSFEKVANQSTTIVDATVLEITKEGKAKLKIHRHLHGANAPATLTGIHLTCFPGLPFPRDFCAPGTRFILCLFLDHLYEGSTAYEVREVGGKSECRLHGLAFKDEWVAVEKFEEMVREVRAPISALLDAALASEKPPLWALPLAPEVRSAAAGELLAYPAVRKSFEKLGAKGTKDERLKGLDELFADHVRAYWCLIACLSHADPSYDLHRRLLARFEKMGGGGKQTVPFLILYGQRLVPVARGGLEVELLLAELQDRTAGVLSVATGVKIELPKDPDERAKAFPGAIKRWQKWLDEQKGR